MGSSAYGGDIANVLRNTIAANVAEKAGISRLAATLYLSEWGFSSGRGASALLQYAAMDELGAEFSPYQKERLGEWLQQSPDYGEAKDVVNTVYDATQARLQDLGYSPDDTITLYRGISMGAKGLKIGDTYPYQGNALESWTTTYMIADSFAPTGGGYVLAAEVPISNIWSTPRTGPGVLWENEMIVINGGEGEVRIAGGSLAYRDKSRKMVVQNLTDEDADWIKSVTAQREGGDTLVVDVLESSDPKSPHVSRASFNQLLNGAEWVYDIHGNEVAPEDGPFRVVEKESHAE
jgi:hypothetical protein